MNRIAYWLGCLTVLLVLSGCVTVQEARDPLQGSGQTQTEGTVFVSITVNTSEVAAFSTIFLTRNQDDNSINDKSYRLTNISDNSSRDTALFVGNLPEGDYRFKQLMASNLKFLDINDAQNEVIGSFRVEPGKVTDLGRLVLTAVNFQVIVGRSKLIPDNLQLTSKLAPRYTDIFSKPAAVQTWNSERHKNDIAEEYASIYPVGAGGLTELASGEIIGGTRMGIVLKRNLDKRWRIFSRTGNLNAVLYTAEYTRGDNAAVIVGDLGTLMRIDKSGKAIDIDPGDLPLGTNFFIDHAPGYSRWFIAVQTKKEAVLYQSAKLEKGTWTRVRSDSIEPSAWSGGRGVWFWRGKGLLGFASTEKGKIECYDYVAKKWLSTTVPDNRRLIGLAGGPGRDVGVITGLSGGFAGAFAKTHYAAECGGAWVETDSPYNVKASPPIPLPSGDIIEGGGVFGDKGLYRSSDRGRTWKKITSDVTVFSERLWVMPKAGLFAISVGANGVESIDHSADGGETWKLELSNLNLKILDKQLNKD